MAIEHRPGRHALVSTGARGAHREGPPDWPARKGALPNGRREAVHGRLTNPHSSRTAVCRRSLAIPVLLAAASLAPHAQDPQAVGAWDPPFALPLIAIHSAVLPTGKVLLFSAEHGVPGIHGWLLDPSTLALTNVPPPAPWNPDCAGHSFLPDGLLLVAGGTLSYSPLTGTSRAYTFDPYAEQWGQIPDMEAGRWYPTCITLDPGGVLTLSGLSEVAGTPNPDIELWDPTAREGWQLLGQRTLPYYPLLHLMPSGLVFMAGPSSVTETYDPIAATWTPVASTNSPGRYEACSVLLPPTLSRVMVLGGYSGAGQPTKSAEIIDLSEARVWRLTAHMQFARMEHNAVLLPDGTVLVIGGRSDNDATPTPVLTPEIFDPASEVWASVAPHTAPRRYHSTAVLLPDGRVLSAGGDFQPSGEIYSPPYLFRGPRPAIASAPSMVTYGSTFALEIRGDPSTYSVVLMGLPAVTHSNNMSQRYVPLGTVTSSGGTVVIPAPASGRVAPPGFYMLFIVDGDGVPSVSRMVRIMSPTLDDQPGRVPPTLTVGKTAAPGSALELNWAPSCSPAADGYGIYEGLIGAWYSHDLIDCDDGGASHTEQVTPAAGDTYYLVVPHTAAAEGSYGKCSVGFCLTDEERPAGGVQCVTPQSAGDCP